VLVVVVVVAVVVMVGLVVLLLVVQAAACVWGGYTQKLKPENDRAELYTFVTSVNNVTCGGR
jgi:hypothetical protein